MARAEEQPAQNPPQSSPALNEQQSGHRIIFLNARRASSQRIGRYKPVEGYAHTSQFFHCGVMDRTQTLDQGFPYAILDSVPKPTPDSTSFAELADKKGKEIVDKAVSSGQDIRVLWSGGIDSTSAIVSLMKATQAMEKPPSIEVMHSEHSVAEYPVFYDRYIKDKLPTVPVDRPIAKMLDPKRINVTGEHGDQIFGSMLLDRYVNNGTAQRPYGATLAGAVYDQLQDAGKADKVVDYLDPQMKNAPIEIKTLFDALWWISFSMKWQHVTLRLPAFSDNAKQAHGSLEHFFRGPGFQNWALTHPEIRQIDDWREYKDEAKKYIFDFTGDADYYREKTKEGSLNKVMRQSAHPRGFRIHMAENFRPITVADDRVMPNQNEFE